MTIEKQYALVKEAVQKHKLKQLMLGTDALKWDNLQHIPADVPSDLSAILKYGLYRLYLEANSDIPDLLLSTINELLQGNSVEIWTAYSIVWYQYRYELTNLSPFKIISNELLVAIRTNIFANKEALIECKEFVGKSYKDGLFEDIVASNDSFYRKFEVSIL